MMQSWLSQQQRQARGVTQIRVTGAAALSQGYEFYKREEPFYEILQAYTHTN